MTIGIAAIDAEFGSPVVIPCRNPAAGINQLVRRVSAVRQAAPDRNTDNVLAGGNYAEATREAKRRRAHAGREIAGIDPVRNRLSVGLAS